MTWAPWQVAWEHALYGPDGFFVRGHAPGAHFRTSVHVGSAFAQAVLDLLSDVDDGLGHPTTLDVVDVGAGGGELLSGLLAVSDDELRRRLVLTGVDRGRRPPGLPDQVRWTDRIPDGVIGLVVANEWLDDVPCPVLVRDEHGDLREVEVERTTGAERLGAPAGVADAIWCSLWWPVEPGERAEVGRSRDQAWETALSRLEFGCAVAIDYAHTRTSRRATLAGYRSGRRVDPVPDGSCDITAHVAMDSCASAGQGIVGSTPLVTTQRAALASYAHTADLPPVELASTDPTAYVRSLQRANEAAELVASNGLGGFGWLVQPVHMPMPTRLATLR